MFKTVPRRASESAAAPAPRPSNDGFQMRARRGHDKISEAVRQTHDRAPGVTVLRLSPVTMTAPVSTSSGRTPASAYQPRIKGQVERRLHRASPRP